MKVTLIVELQVERREAFGGVIEAGALVRESAHGAALGFGCAAVSPYTPPENALIEALRAAFSDPFASREVRRVDAP